MHRGANRKTVIRIAATFEDSAVSQTEKGEKCILARSIVLQFACLQVMFDGTKLDLVASRHERELFIERLDEVLGQFPAVLIVD